MATTTATESATPEVFAWLKNLPLAPEYHPTLSEFQDPISYIFKVEKEASRYGICKIVPPVQAPAKKTAITNLNRSLSSSSINSSPKSSRFSPTFTTRQQQIGFCPRKHHPVQKPVWKSGEYYTFHEFEAKAKGFEKNYLKRSRKKSLSALEMETLFWKACVDKPFSVEYANDMPGSAFVFPPEKGREFVEALDAVNVGETSWNMRGVSRSKGSLLRFMKEEIPGVTSPMLYIAMLFSWFAWHVEDHDLHSLNYLHMGAGKTWYGVPRDAAVAFEEVVRVHGYGGEINRLVTFAILGEKTTVMSPEVFLSAGIPCCRLVQNAGEFVVTFPKAYHCGFSHGFNCGEAANIATPEWLRFAKDAAIRRASINYPLLVSHIQLLYDLALALCSSVSMNTSVEPRSSRLKDKKKGEGEALVKELFVKNVIQNNDLLHNLGKGSSVVLFPQNSPYISIRSRSHSTMKSRLSLGLCSPEEAMNASKGLFSENQSKGLFPVKGISSLHGFRHRLPSYGSSSDDACIIDSHAQKRDGKGDFFCGQSYWLPENGMLSCVTCGILCFACFAIVQPKETASRYLMSADCSFFNDWTANSGVTKGEVSVTAEDAADSQINSCSDDGLYDVPILSGDYQTPAADKIIVPAALKTETHETTSALGLLASTYGNSSDSEEDQIEHEVPCAANETDSGNYSSESTSQSDHSQCSSSPSHHELRCEIIDPYWGRGGPTNADLRGRNLKMFAYSDDFEVDNPIHVESNSSDGMARDSVTMSDIPSSFSPVSFGDEKTKIGNAILSLSEVNLRSGVDDSSRVHVFCLEHALEVEQLLSSIGGSHKLLVCNTEYPKVDAEARALAEELGIVHVWNDNTFRDATKEDSERIQIALDSEECVPGNGDWTVKLGVNLFYSAILSRSRLYSKQMPYNSVMYTAFGCSSPTKFKEKGCGKQKKIVLAGKWCGKVWMSNQVHPLLVPRDQDEHESKPERKTLTSTFNAKILKNNGKKRKICFENERILKKSKCPQTERVLRTSPGSYYSEQKQRDFRNSREKKKLGMEREEMGLSDLEGGPSTRLRRRFRNPVSKQSESKKNVIKKATKGRLLIKQMQKNVGKSEEEEEDFEEEEEEEAHDFQCDVEGCSMGFGSKQELGLHKRNICPVKGCGKKFFSHKYLVQHRRVHVDDRPLKCPWRGCKMAFKWAWARTEHIRVHTGARPYVCNEPGCGQTFRFVSDFSRHKRKTGHSAKKKKSKR